MASIEIPVGPEKGGHPRGLVVLFGAEMWERFSYYGMRALLVLYLTNSLKWPRLDALDLYATYTGLVYLTPLLGGYLADRYIGQRKAILVGGIVIAAGHFTMVFEPLLNLGLGLIVLGTGFFKPNISTMVGQLYPQGDSRRDAGYTIFYVGINVGAAISPIVCGILAERYGWHYGFAAAGVGMVLGIINFGFCQRMLGTAGYGPGRDGATGLRVADWMQVVVLAVIGYGLVYLAIAGAPTVRAGLPKGVASLGVVGFWSLLTLPMILAAAITRRLVDLPPAEAITLREVAAPSQVAPPIVDPDDSPLPWYRSSIEWQRVVVILVVSTFSILFWMAFEQAGGTMSLFADAKTERGFLGMTIPAAFFQSINAVFIICLAPLFSVLWTWMDRSRFRLNSAAKMGLGLVFVGLAFAVMGRADALAGSVGKVGPQWLTMVYLLNTIGEICISPIGLSLVNKLAPAKIASLMMASWFLCTAAANYLAGKLEGLLHDLEKQGTTINLWNFLVYSSIGPGILLLIISPLMKKLSHGRL